MEPLKITQIQIHSPGDESVGLFPASWFIEPEAYIDPEYLEAFREGIRAAWEYISDNAIVRFVINEKPEDGFEMAGNPDMEIPNIIKDHETEVQSFQTQRTAMLNLLIGYKSATKIIPEHSDPGSVVDCYNYLWDKINECYNTIQFLYEIRNINTKNKAAKLFAKPHNKYLSIQEVAKLYGKKVKCKQLNPDGNDWLDKKMTVNAHFLKEMEQGSIKEACR